MATKGTVPAFTQVFAIKQMIVMHAALHAKHTRQVNQVFTFFFQFVTAIALFLYRHDRDNILVDICLIYLTMPVDPCLNMGFLIAWRIVCFRVITYNAPLEKYGLRFIT